MIFDMRGLHLGDVLLAMPAMRIGDAVIVQEQHRVPGAPVAWLDTGTGTVRASLGHTHETRAWLNATGRAPERHQLLPPPEQRHGVVLATEAAPGKRWPHWLELQRRLGPDALVVDDSFGRAEWMAALNGALVVVCHDNATAHMADALGVPKVVVLHGMGWPHYNRYRPFWNARDCIVRDTMDAITVEEVMGVVRA